MVLGMTLSTFTLVHVIISLIGIVLRSPTQLPILSDARPHNRSAVDSTTGLSTAEPRKLTTVVRFQIARAAARMRVFQLAQQNDFGSHSRMILGRTAE